MKKKVFIIILSLTAFVAILFLIAFIDHVVNDPIKEAQKIIKDFNRNEKTFTVIKDYMLNHNSGNEMYVISKKILFDISLTDDEYNCFHYLFENLNYSYVHYYAEITGGYKNAVVFTYNSKFTISRTIIYTGDDWELGQRDATGLIDTNLGNGWHFNSFGYV